jgi:hypothetical protein
VAPGFTCGQEAIRVQPPAYSLLRNAEYAEYAELAENCAWDAGAPALKKGELPRDANDQ